MAARPQQLNSALPTLPSFRLKMCCWCLIAGPHSTVIDCNVVAVSQAYRVSKEDPDDVSLRLNPGGQWYIVFMWKSKFE